MVYGRLEDCTSADLLNLCLTYLLAASILCPLICCGKRHCVKLSEAEIVCVTVVVADANLASNTKLFPEEVLDSLDHRTTVNRKFLV